MNRRLRVLAITRLFPNTVEPHAAAFNRQQFAALAKVCDLDVLAVIPWFPGAGLFGRWSLAGRLALVPESDRIDGLLVRHPRVLYVPKVGHAFAPALYAASLAARLRRYRGRIDVVLGSWAFPDGVAAVTLARRLGVPSVVKVHGSDINVLAQMSSARRQLARALPRAERVIAVSRGLADKVRQLGVPEEKIALVRNGVDRAVFKTRDRTQARAALGHATEGKWILYVGRLERAKGVLDLLAAFAKIGDAHPDLRLVMVGGGSEEQQCRAFASTRPGRVIVSGARPLAEVATWMAACDVLTLPSWNEGTPNVLLEAMASGRRVVATSVGGIPDVITGPEVGAMVPPKQPGALAAALLEAVATPYDPEALSAAAPGDWDDSASRVLATLYEAMGARSEAAMRLGGISVAA